MLFAWHHPSHLEADLGLSLLRPTLSRFASAHTLIRYDVRGSGLSEPLRPEDTLDEHVADMKAVADAAGLERFPIVAVLQNAAVAARFAARYPERVSCMVFWNAYVMGRAIRAKLDGSPPADRD